MLKVWFDGCFQGVALKFSFSKLAQISVTASGLDFNQLFQVLFCSFRVFQYVHFLILHFMFVLLSFWFPMVILKQSWVVARDFLVYLMSIIAFIIYLDLIACLKWLYSSESYTGSSKWFRSNVELWWHFHLNLSFCAFF